MDGVRLMPENYTAWDIYRRVCNQHIMGQMGPVSLMAEPVFRLMDIMQVDDKLGTLDLVTKTYHAVLGEID